MTSQMSFSSSITHNNNEENRFKRKSKPKKKTVSLKEDIKRIVKPVNYMKMNYKVIYTSQLSNYLYINEEVYLCKIIEDKEITMKETEVYIKEVKFKEKDGFFLYFIEVLMRLVEENIILVENIWIESFVLPMKHKENQLEDDYHRDNRHIRCVNIDNIDNICHNDEKDSFQLENKYKKTKSKTKTKENPCFHREFNHKNNKEMEIISNTNENTNNQVNINDYYYLYISEYTEETYESLFNIYKLKDRINKIHKESIILKSHIEKNSKFNVEIDRKLYFRLIDLSIALLNRLLFIVNNDLSVNSISYESIYININTNEVFLSPSSFQIYDYFNGRLRLERQGVDYTYRNFTDEDDINLLSDYLITSIETKENPYKSNINTGIYSLFLTFKAKNYSNLFNIWSIGCILYKIFYQKDYIFDCPSSFSQRESPILTKGKYKEIDEIISICMERDYKKRPNIQSVLDRMSSIRSSFLVLSRKVDVDVDDSMKKTDFLSKIEDFPEKTENFNEKIMENIENIENKEKDKEEIGKIEMFSSIKKKIENIRKSRINSSELDVIKDNSLKNKGNKGNSLNENGFKIFDVNRIDNSKDKSMDVKYNDISQLNNNNNNNNTSNININNNKKCKTTKNIEDLYSILNRFGSNKEKDKQKEAGLNKKILDKTKNSSYIRQFQKMTYDDNNISMYNIVKYDNIGLVKEKELNITSNFSNRSSKSKDKNDSYIKINSDLESVSNMINHIRSINN